MTARPQPPAIGGRRGWILAACCLATSAKNAEPPLYLFRPPVEGAFNAGWIRYSLSIGALTL